MLSLIIFLLPVFLGLIIWLLPSNKSKWIALFGSKVSFVLSVVAYVFFKTSYTNSLSFSCNWISQLGIQFSLGMDGLSVVLVLLTSLLVPFIVLTTRKHHYENANVFYALILFMEAGLLGVFMAQDAFMFYVFYELALIPIYFICGLWGGEKRISVTLKFFIYTIAGSLFMLLGIIYLYFKTPGTHTFAIESFYHLSLTASEQAWLFWAFFIAFAVKIPVFPFHSWQPATYTEAPYAGSMLLAGIMLKMGLYGMLRFMVPLLPLGFEAWGNTALILCIIGVIYGSVIAFRQDDLKTLIAFSSLSHVGLIAAGILTVNAQGMQGAVLQMFNHGINVVAIFALVSFIEQTTGTRKLSELGGMAAKQPMFAVLFMIVLLGSIGLPLTNGFVGEFLLLNGVFNHSMLMAVVAGLSIIFGAVYMLRLYRNAFQGEINHRSEKIGEMTLLDKLAFVPLALLVLILGVCPGIITSVSESATQSLIQFFNQTHSL